MRIVLFGSPGVGKGTQSERLAERRGLSHISTGIILRRAMEEGSSLGEEVRTYVEAGELVPDGVMCRLAEEAITEQDGDNYVLDGYPRTLRQARWLNDFLERHAAPLDAVISLEVPDEVIVGRLSKRRVHKHTGENFHLEHKPPPPEVDPELIIQRRDDRPEAIRKRLEVYAEETAPVLDFYRSHRQLYPVNGVGTFDEVYRRIEAVLEAAEIVDRT